VYIIGSSGNVAATSQLVAAMQLDTWLWQDSYEPLQAYCSVFLRYITV